MEHKSLETFFFILHNCFLEQKGGYIASSVIENIKWAIGQEFKHYSLDELKKAWKEYSLKKNLYDKNIQDFIKELHLDFTLTGINLTKLKEKSINEHLSAANNGECKNVQEKA